MMVTFGIGCCRIKFVNTSSAGGQLEHPSDVNNSTSTATGWSIVVDIVRPARGAAPVPQDNTRPAAMDASNRARMTELPPIKDTKCFARLLLKITSGLFGMVDVHS